MNVCFTVDLVLGQSNPGGNEQELLKEAHDYVKDLLKTEARTGKHGLYIREIQLNGPISRADLPLSEDQVIKDMERACEILNAAYAAVHPKGFSDAMNSPAGQAYFRAMRKLEKYRKTE